MTPHKPPHYLQAGHDRAIWHALAAAMQQVRDEATRMLLDSAIDVESLFGGATNAVDEEIRTALIPRALAEQERHLPAGVALPPFAAQVLFSCLRGYAELDPLFLDPEVTEVRCGQST